MTGKSTYEPPRFDGFEISNYNGKLTGTFEMDEAEASQLRLDRVAVFVIAARLNKAVVENTKEGDVNRTNTFVVSELRMVTGELRDQAITFLADESQGAMDFGVDDEDDDDLEALEESLITTEEEPALT